MRYAHSGDTHWRRAVDRAFAVSAGKEQRVAAAQVYFPAALARSAFAIDVHRQKDVVAAVLGPELAQSAQSAGKNVCAREKPLSNRRAWYAVAQRLDSHDAARFQVTQGIAPSGRWQPASRKADRLDCRRLGSHSWPLLNSGASSCLPNFSVLSEKFAPVRNVVRLSPRLQVRSKSGSEHATA